ncbi:MAG: AmmeMemoRadiSam system radical SAM enzyme [Candidatus Moranbacteria bacterium RIFOXYC1_FULL_44_13]|nr:MAG: AmmeMemoRadiSam system radical SAM enzyme [Candidatus Moranbacteria bacterium RIFOXYC1_FULL_44_13]
MKESVLYERLGNNNVRCKTCNHFCLVAPGHRGVCGVRENVDGKLYFLAYGRAVAASIDPVEKKPLYHFLPGTFTFSIATVGCNFRCGNCQNWQISQFSKSRKATREMIAGSGENLPPKEVVRLAKESGCPSISYTYTEPTIFLEYALDTMKLARKAGLKNIWVSNGFMSPETLELVAPYLDAINIDIKSFDDKFYLENCGARLKPVLENCKEIVKKKIWLEITTLIIPKLSDDKKMLEKIANFIRKELGDFVPWHVSAFSGAISWKLQRLSETPVEKVKEACEIGKKAGLKHVYTGNI